ncbi:MAG: phenylalanine--tRNA ligase subunit beta [Cyanobacteriota bacterium]|nr:phenylalanine--tRNA ligase subunit beta [Cyanobacteriota bacterium]
MRVSLQWLQELVSAEPESLSISRLADRLSISGFEVDAVDDLAARAEGVVVGLVLERNPHPDADKLSVCQVDIGGSSPLQIVCGASNVRQGIHVPVALVGTFLPAVNLTIKPAELRGVSSHGMICSLAELGLQTTQDGIAILDSLSSPVPPLGSPVGPLLGLDDQVLELAITANRPDGLSMAGIAREVAAIVGGHTTIPSSVEAITAQPLPAEPASLALMEEGGIFSVTELTGIHVAPSPLWLQQRLEKAGIRPINNVVDITNLVMLESGQPLHAFDRDRLTEAGIGSADPAEIGLRYGRPGETLVTLDGVCRPLSPETLLVTYSDQPVALAGVMGGEAEAVMATTSTIWLEAAVFAAAAVRRSSRAVGLRTEASSRFEKGLPTEATLAASDRAVALFQELCGATVTQRWLSRRPTSGRLPLRLRRDALQNLLGPVLVDGVPCDLSDDQVEDTLRAIGCLVEAEADGWQVQVPPARGVDLLREVDLIEEVARLVGYDRFCCHLPDPVEPGGLTAQQQVERLLRQSLVGAGLQEACSFSLVKAAPDRLALANPLLADYGHLRNELLTELLSAARRNLQSGASGFWAFELGEVFPDPSTGASRGHLAGVICGERRAEWWSNHGKAQPPDYYQARGLLQQALDTLSIPVHDTPLQHHPLLHPGRAARVSVEGRSAGWFGQLHPSFCEEQELPESSYAFELEMGELLAAATRRARWIPVFRPFATVPASERDLAVVVPTDMAAATLVTVIRKAGRPLLEQSWLMDRYSGDQVGEGLCSLTFRLRFRDPARTLTDEEVEAGLSRIISALETQPGLQLRV